MRKYLVFILFVVAAVAAALVSIFWYFSATAAPSSRTDEVRFVITKGSSATKIAADLEEAGLIKSALAFKVYTQLNDEAGSIPPGEFSVPQNLSIEELIAHLREGPTELWVSIPEGLRREEIAERVISQLNMSGADAIAFREEFLALTRDEEGYLYPDTYLFPKDASAQVVVDRLTSTFDTKFTYDGSGVLTREEAVILASIIERETITAEERPMVAGILLNRISEDWPLQADATAQYALGTSRCGRKIGCDWWVPPTRDDLQINSPYNTYVVQGLPPGPISNPGISSLNAAANPTPNDYMFYIHDTDQIIRYAETLDEHNANVQRYLR